MGRAPTVEHYRFDAWDLPTKYGWMHTGPGVRAATEVQDIVNQMADRMISSGSRVGTLLNGAEWVGAAATAAGQAMQRGAGQINQTAVEAATAQRCVTELGESFTAAQHRVPAPNEVPSGLGDAFRYGAAEGFNALSPFDVQSPLHEAMEQRRELDHQANLALTEHMTTSRDRVEAIPAVTAPAPITVAEPSAAAPGAGGGIGSPAPPVPATGGPGPAPVATSTAGWPGVATPPQAVGPDPVTGVRGPAPLVGGPGPVTGPAPTLPTGWQDGRSPGSRPTGSGPGRISPGPGGTGFGARAGRRAGEVAAGAAGFGTRPGGDGPAGRGIPGVGGQAAGRPPTAAGGGRFGGAGVGRPGSGSFLQPPLGSRGSDDDDLEHKDRYAQHADHIVGELPLVAPAVIGESPEEEDQRLRHTREGQ